MNNNLQLVLKSSTTEMSLNDHDAGIYIVPELDGLTGLPEIRTTSGVNAGYDGGWTSAQKFDARSIVIRGVIANEDKTEVERMRRELVALLAQGKNEQLELDFVTETGRAYEVQVRTIACDMAMQRVLTQQEFMITLRADDPLIYDNSSAGEEATVNVSGATGGFRIPFEIPLAIDAGSEETVVQNSGLESVAPTIKMYGALHNPKIINHTTNQAMQIEAELGFTEGAWTTPVDAPEGTNVSFEPEREAPIESAKLKGDTYQQTSPNPDYPQDIQVVTGENTVKIRGKNLLYISSVNATDNGVANTLGSDGSITCSGTVGSGWNGWTIMPYVSNSIQAGTYTLSIDHAINVGMNITFRDSSNTNIVAANIPVGSTSATVSLPREAAKYSLWMNGTTGTAISFTIKAQLVAGSTPDYNYEPYQEQSYEVNLGNIELCKIGTYQDYIYKDGDSWKIHKAIGKYVYNNDLSGNGITATRVDMLTPALPVAPNSTTIGTTASNMYQNSVVNNTGLGGTTALSCIRIMTSIDFADSYNAVKALAAANNLTIYYLLATPTDTAITNTALIEQLDALVDGNAVVYEGETNIVVTAAEGDLPGIAAIRYYTDKEPDQRDELIVDSRLKTVTLNGLDVYHLQAPGSEFLMLAPGENKLSLQSDITGDNGYAKVSYKQGYLSI